MQPTELASTPVRRIVSALVLGVLVTAASLAVRAEETIRIVITESIEGAVPIAIVPFAWKGTGPAPARLAEIVADDLARTGRFEPIPFPDLPSRPAEPAEVNFSDWRLLGTGNLVIGNVTPKGPDRFSIEFRLFDVFRARQLTGFQIDSAGKDLRRVAHQVSDVVYEALTGERGAFDTRIAYVTETGAGDAKRYALNVADSDGFNAFTILETREPVLSPAWSPDGGRLAYVSYDGERPRIYVQDLASGKRDEVAGYAGINGAPAWSPDGRRLAMTLSKDGNPEIYLMDVTSRRLRRVTSNFAIDTEPTWSPDGQRLLFTSDRSGGPQLYEVDVGGGTPRRVTFDGRYNARGRYSPDGERIAFVHGKDGGFHVAVLERANDALRVLTETRLDESPSFAPNGSMILYATVDGGVSTLAAVSTDGRMRQQLGVQRGKVREPAWSPFRPR